MAPETGFFTIGMDGQTIIKATQRLSAASREVAAAEREFKGAVQALRPAAPEDIGRAVNLFVPGEGPEIGGYTSRPYAHKVGDLEIEGTLYTKEGDTVDIPTGP
jgi:hypothetical protein